MIQSWVLPVSWVFYSSRDGGWLGILACSLSGPGEGFSPYESYRGY